MLRRVVRSKTLFSMVVSQVSIWVLLLMGILAVLAYVGEYRRISEREIDAALRTVIREAEKDNQLFRRAEYNARVFSEQFLSLYLSDIRFSQEDFDRLFFVGDRGATRLRPRYFESHLNEQGELISGMSGIVGNNQPTDDPEFRRRLILAFTVVSRFGPAWIDQFANLHATFPENALIIYWPDESWGLDADADLRMNELGVISQTLQENNPDREAVWTGLYFDETAREWMITYEAPLDHNGRHLVNPSQDVFMTEIIEQLKTQTVGGGHNYIVSDDGHVVVYSSRDLDEDMQTKGLIRLETLEDPELTHAYELLKRADAFSSEEPTVVEDDQVGDYHIAVPLDGPNWLLVATYPKQRLIHQANRSATRLLVLGGGMLLSFLLVLLFFMKREIADPMAILRHATLLWAEGDFQTNEPTEKLATMRTEVGQLASAFLRMAWRVRDTNTRLEHIVQQRTAELEDANRKLLELSLLDGLTGVHNRRSFDRDLAAVFRQAKEKTGSFMLLLADIDCFKAYNDRYGHTAGDDALKRVASILSDSVRSEDRVYRYGGEEFAVIFNNTDISTARSVAKRILARVRKTAIPHESSPGGFLSISAGMSAFDPSFRTPNDLITDSDQKLYRAKSDGKDRITV